MIYIICYDIKYECVNDPKAAKRLNSVSRILQNYGLRRQRSIFECILEKERLQALKQELQAVIDRKKDSIRIYPMCEKCLKLTIVQGIGEVIEIKEYEIA
ncbi:MAG: CRISPR-associated endonuclease Cas2 [Deltaproteobacteria bacterium]|nr:CRISPR-associated endonuclease Cas2 [Deltaproteobacteria bacterium]